MVIRLSRFNTYLALLAAAALLCGCQSAEGRRKKQTAVLRVHIEVVADQTAFTEQVSVIRASPMTFHASKNAFLLEGNVAGARLLEDRNGFAIEVRFDSRGTMLLEQYTAANPGRHLLIFSQFGEKLEKARWLAAPMIQRRISNGVLAFTPDANREEAEQIVLGLNNLAKKTQPKPES